MTTYFIMSDAGEVPERWYLNEPVSADGKPVDPWQFTAGRPLEVLQPLVFTKFQRGLELPFSLAAFEIPVADNRTAQLLAEVGGADVQLLPARIDGVQGSYWIVNVVALLDCVDEQESKFTRFNAAHRPDLAGKYQMFVNLRIDPAKAEGHQIFRIKDWEAPIVVSDRLRAVLEQLDLPGLTFTPA